MEILACLGEPDAIATESAQTWLSQRAREITDRLLRKIESDDPALAAWVSDLMDDRIGSTF